MLGQAQLVQVPQLQPRPRVAARDCAAGQVRHALPHAAHALQYHRTAAQDSAARRFPLQGHLQVSRLPVQRVGRVGAPLRAPEEGVAHGGGLARADRQLINAIQLQGRQLQLHVRAGEIDAADGHGRARHHLHQLRLRQRQLPRDCDEARVQRANCRRQPRVRALQDDRPDALRAVRGQLGAQARLHAQGRRALYRLLHYDAALRRLQGAVGARGRGEFRPRAHHAPAATAALDRLAARPTLARARSARHRRLTLWRLRTVPLRR